MAKRWRACVEYDGTDFVGWQRQRGGRSVQGVLEAALAVVTGEAVRVVGAGRTDAGVHALGQVAHFDTAWSRSGNELMQAVNARLPGDVVVHRLEPAPSAFHARHSAVSRTYVYRLRLQPTRSPLTRRTSLQVPWNLDDRLMAGAALAFVGTHDFGGFGRPTTADGSTVRRVDRFEVRRAGAEMVLEVEGNAFLRHQVRRMVGLLLEVGRGRVPPESVEASLLRTPDAPRPRSVPPQGLVLVAVAYPSEETLLAAWCRQEQLGVKDERSENDHHQGIGYRTSVVAGEC